MSVENSMKKSNFEHDLQCAESIDEIKSFEESSSTQLSDNTIAHSTSSEPVSPEAKHSKYQPIYVKDIPNAVYA